MATSVISKPAPSRLRRVVIAWLPTAAWLTMIAFFSTDTFSAEHTGGVLERIFSVLHIDVSARSFEIIHHLIRKGAHFSVYGFLSLLAFYSWRATLVRRVSWTFTWSGLALLITLMAATYDEVHQIFVPSRGPSPYDVMLDMMGALFVQILIASFSETRKTQSGPAGTLQGRR